MDGTKKQTTIRDHICKLLTQSKKDTHLYNFCSAFDRDIKNLIQDVDDHLTKIQGQMPDYDKHDASHSEKVLRRIEELLGPVAINNIPFLEAEMLLLCCHFHDTGMALPDWCFTLLKRVEAPDFTFHKNRSEVMIALHSPNSGWSPSKSHNEVKELFLIPRKEPDFFEWLADEIWEYELFRQGLESWNGKGNREQWVCESREEYLRSTHGKRSGIYSKNIGKALNSLSRFSAIQKKLSLSIGAICFAHTQPVDAVWKLTGSEVVNPGFSNPALTYNPEFLAMLLRLGDVLDFSEDRASRTLYAEHNPMNRNSDKHWQAKNLTGLSVEIKSSAHKTKQIRFMGSFNNPEHYYFIHDYLQWADEELKNYASFLETMERDNTQPKRYDLCLPREVDRTSVEADEFTPDSDLKFTLEQRRIIELLMGVRLYTDNFTCLRELYQNALDASRCMQAENRSKGRGLEKLPIHFGLETDEETGRTFLYCRDQGVGMTKETVKNYLLRVGNSYYRSAQFRRDNALWDNVVVPVSEFGIGLLSCYMIGDRIEVLTRHFGDGQEYLWVCMESTEDYGYFRELSQSLRDRLGGHGTEVRVFLKEEALKQIENSLPVSQEDALDRIALTYGFGSRSQLNETRYSYKSVFHTQKVPLWYRLQAIICVPEPDFPVSVCAGHQVYTLQVTQKRYPLETRLTQIADYLSDNYNMASLYRSSTWGEQVSVSFTDSETGSEARCFLFFPASSAPLDNDYFFTYNEIGPFLYPACSRFCVAGLATNSSILIPNIPQSVYWNFKGIGRPALSVSRESITSLPPSFSAVRERLLDGLYREISSAITRYYGLHPEHNTEQVRSFLLAHLWITLGDYLNICNIRPMLPSLWQYLSVGLFRGHCEAGLPLEALQDKPFSFSLIPAKLHLLGSESLRNPLSDIVPTILLRAKHICLEEDSISVEINEAPKNLKQEPITESNLSFGHEVLYRADSGAMSWEQWDIISNILPFVSPGLFRVLSGEGLGSGWAKQADVPNGLLTNALLHNFNPLGEGLDPILPQLQVSDWAIITKDPYIISVDYSNGAPLLLVRISPVEITTEAEQAIQTYSSIPNYEKGIREGWTLLLYPLFQDNNLYGRILAPGIVDRFEMVTHIPDNIVDAAMTSGYPLHFTDGTLAFPESK